MMRRMTMRVGGKGKTKELTSMMSNKIIDLKLNKKTLGKDPAQLREIMEEEYLMPMKYSK